MPMTAPRDASDKPTAHDATSHPEPQAAVLAVAQVVDAAFQRFDANADGVITADELAVEVDPSGRFPDLVTHLAAALTLVDGDADGGVDKDELTAAVQQVDSNGDGTVSRSELSQARQDDSPVTALLDAHPVRGAPDDDRHDTEPDGKPVSALVDQLFTLDSNGDNQISLSELLTLADNAALAPATAGSADAATTLVIDAGQAPAHGGPGGPPIDFTALVTAVFTAIDTNHDAFLSRDEVTVALNALDTNQDGRIDHADEPLANWDQQSIELIGLLVHDQLHGDHG